jgi:FAD synthetase
LSEDNQAETIKQRRIALGRVYSDRFREPLDDGRYQFEVITDSHLKKLVDSLILDGYLTRNANGSLELTHKGRLQITVVMTGGAFDILHPGHLETLEQARRLGDVLIVSVARNSTYIENKKRNPLHDESVRRRLVGALRPVDAAILGSEKDIFETVDLLKPDVIALGYDQVHNEETIQKELIRRNLSAKVVRLTSSDASIKSSKIMREFY